MSIYFFVVAFDWFLSYFVQIERHLDLGSIFLRLLPRWCHVLCIVSLQGIQSLGVPTWFLNFPSTIHWWFQYPKIAIVRIRYFIKGIKIGLFKMWSFLSHLLAGMFCIEFSVIRYSFLVTLKYSFLGKQDKCLLLLMTNELIYTSRYLIF